MIVKVTGFPGQEFNVGVTVTVVVPVVVGVNEAIFPFPLAAKPNPVFEFVQA